MDDLDLDEHGIFREKAGGSNGSGDQGILVDVDEDGIWREDTDDPLSHYTDPLSHFRQSDSGIGVDKKSSSATLNQVKSDFGSEEDYHQVVPAYRQELYGRLDDNIGLYGAIGDNAGNYGDSSSQIDSKSTTSYHISELEASASVQGDVSFEQDSDQPLDFPELVDDSYLLSDQSNQKNNQSDNHSAEHSVDLDQYIDPQQYSEDSLYKSHRPFALDPEVIGYDDDEDDDGKGDEEEGEDDHYSSSGGEVSDIGEEYDDFHDNHMMVTKRERTDDSRPPITGDSIFTQEEFSHKHSLHEFEKLEAALDDSGSENGEKMDLIGAYLRGLEDQEEDDLDQEVASHDPSVRQRQQQSGLRGSKIPVRSPTRTMSRSSTRSLSRSESRSPSRPMSKSPSRIPSYRGGSPNRSNTPSNNRPRSRGYNPGYRMGSPSRIPRRSPVRAIHSPSMRRQSFSPRSPRVFDTFEYQKTRDTISMISGSVDEIMLEPGGHSFDEEDNRREPREGEPELGDTAASFAFDTSLILDQKFPYVEDPYSSLHYADDRPDSRNESLRITKIPMLRSRSPSMSRPGSSLSRSNSRGPGSRPQSPARKLMVLGPNQTGIPAPLQSALKRRSLPITPQKRKGDSQDEWTTTTPRSHEVSILLPPQVDSPTSARFMDHHTYNQLSQPESELGRATNLLMMDAEDLEAKDTVTKLPDSFGGNRQRVLSPGSRQRDRSPTGKQRNHSPEYSGGEDLSQGSTTSKSELKTRYVQEVHHRKHNEDTINQLSIEYSNLLKKYAEAENTIDELRLGAKVKLYSDSPTPMQAQAGVLGYQPVMGIGPTPSQAVSGSMGAVGQAGGGVMSAGVMSSGGGGRSGVAAKPSTSQQGQQMSSQSSSAGSIHPPSFHQSLSRDELDSLAGEGVKLSLLAKAKAIEEQVNAFQILLNENHLNIEDQTRALDNIKSNYDNLQTDYSGSKEEHEYMRRQGALSEASLDPGFDENQEVAGEIYRLNMKLDQIEHNVAENKKKQVVRKPFSGKPVKGDHSLVGDDPGAQTANSLTAGRAASTGSMAGAASVDDKLHQLSKDYSGLMDRYRRLKGLRKSPQTDNQISELLENIKAIYKQTPDHRKPALPAELQRLYDPSKGEFLDPEDLAEQEEEETVSPRSVFSDTRKTSGDRPGSQPQRRGRFSSVDSDPSTEYTDKTPARERYNRGGKAADQFRDNPRERSNSKYSPSGSQHSPRDKYADRAGNDALTETREGRKLPRPGPGSRRKDGLWAGRGGSNDKAWKKDGGTEKGSPWRKDMRDEKDSGYVGSELGSRKTAATTGSGSRGLPKRGVTGTGTSFPRSSHDMADGDSDASSSDSADSVIERKLSRSRSGTKDSGHHGNQLQSSDQSEEVDRPKSDKRGELRGQQQRSRSRSKGRSVVNSESSITSGEKGSPRSEKIQSLSDEVERLKATLNPNQVLIQGQPHQIVSGVQAGAPPMMHQMGVTPMQPNNNVMNYANTGVAGNPVVPGMPVQSATTVGQAGVMGQPLGYMNNNSAYIPYQEYPQTGYEYYDGYHSAPPIDNKENYFGPEYADEYYEDGSPDYYRPSHDRQGREPYYSSADVDGYNSRGGDNYRDPYTGSRRDSYTRGKEPYSSKNRDSYSGDRRGKTDPYYEPEDYESRDPYRDFEDFNDRKANSLDGDRFDYRSRSSRDRHHGDRHGERRQGHRSKSREKSPNVYSEMRKRYIPHRREFSGSPERHRQYSPGQYSGNRNPPPSRGVTGRPPPYPAAHRSPHYRPVNHLTAPPPPTVVGHVAPPTAAVNHHMAPQHHMAPHHPLASMNSHNVSGYTPTPAAAAAYIPAATPVVNTMAGVPNANQMSVGTTAGYTPYSTGVTAGPASCPMCGGQGQHSHANFVFQPNASQTTGSGMVPVQLVPAANEKKGGSKVRYYVREYGGESDGIVARRPTYKAFSDSEDEDLNDSLEKAMQTAKKLKKMSVRMKQTLHDEINRSIQESSFLMT